MRQFAARLEAFESRGVSIVAVFHSPVEALGGFARGQAPLPYPVLADPRRQAYRAWGVSGGLVTIFRPSSWRRAWEARRHGYRPRWRDALRDGIGVCPGDFLIGADGVIARVRYGRHFTDSLLPEDALRWVREA